MKPTYHQASPRRRDAVPVKYLDSPGWFYVDRDAGLAYFMDKEGGVAEVPHRATLGVSRRHLPQIDALLKKVLRLRIQIVEIDEPA